MITICRHPIVQESLGRLRDKATAPAEFQGLLEQVALVMGVEALAGARSKSVTVQTPLKAAKARVLDQPVVLAAVLRAGLGFLPGLLRVAPRALIGHIGLYRNEETLNPVRYYVRLPKEVDRGIVLLCDPMLATGGSAVEAINILKSNGAKKIRYLCLVATRQGLRRVEREHPDVHVFAAAVDPVLNSQGYIVPGLGDAGDRLFGT